jgi:hypothetical protein
VLYGSQFGCQAGAYAAAMAHDQQGNPSSSTPAALEQLEVALDGFLHFRGSLPAAIQAALEADPNCALAWALDGYLGVLATDARQAQAAEQRLRQFLGQAKLGQYQQRERDHLLAAQTLLAGDFEAASQQLEAISLRHPRDLLALAVGHQLDFFTGNSRMLRDRPAAVLSAWSPDDRYYPNILGMLSFGLCECHQHDRAFEVGLAAVAGDRHDVWAIHALGHTFEETGRFEDGLQFYDAHGQYWQENNYFIVHNTWHYALFALEAGDVARVLALFDAIVFNSNAAIALQLLDASALLWRVYLTGVAQATRFAALAQQWLQLHEPPFYAFNDMHQMMALAGAGHWQSAQHLIDSREQWLKAASSDGNSSNSNISNINMTRNIGLPVCRALLAFAQGQYPVVIAHLWPIRRRLAEFGGSHAQRDVLQKTLIEACLRAKDLERARVLVSERLSLRPRSRYNQQTQARVLALGP